MVGDSTHIKATLYNNFIKFKIDKNISLLFNLYTLNSKYYRYLITKLFYLYILIHKGPFNTHMQHNIVIGQCFVWELILQERALIYNIWI